MPSFGMYTSEGTLTAWTQPDGAAVQIGQVIAEIETDKSTHELPSPASGVLQHVAVVGTLLKEEGVLGYVLAAGESITAPNHSTQSTDSTIDPSPRDYIKASPIAKRLAKEHGVDLAALNGSGPGGRIVEADVLAAVEKPVEKKVEQPTAVVASAPPVIAVITSTPIAQ